MGKCGPHCDRFTLNKLQEIEQAGSLQGNNGFTEFRKKRNARGY